MIKLPKDWSTWGSFPDKSSLDLYTYNVIWRAFSPDKMFMISIIWREEQDPKGSMICSLDVDQDYRNPQYITKPSSIKELIRDVQNILNKLPDIYGKMKNVETAEDVEENERTTLLEASSVIKPKKRKYTKRAEKWKNK